MSKRTWYRLTHARQQLRYSLLAPTLGLSASIAFAVAGRVSTQTLLRSLASEWPVDPSTIESLAASIDWSTALIIGSASVVAVLQAVVTVVWSRRVFGPEIPLLNHVKNLNAGDYASRVTLRQHDEFQALARELNALAIKLGSGAR